MMTLGKIQELSLADQFLMMESLWKSISPYEDQVTVPQWHKELLDQREGLLHDGKIRCIDWALAKSKFKKLFHENCNP
jgi:hypothetical protein